MNLDGEQENEEYEDALEMGSSAPMPPPIPGPPPPVPADFSALTKLATFNSKGSKGDKVNTHCITLRKQLTHMTYV